MAHGVQSCRAKLNVQMILDVRGASTRRAPCHCDCTFMHFVRAHSCSLCVHIRAVCACTLVQFVLMQWVHCLGSLCVILRNADEYAYDLGRSGSECETLIVSALSQSAHCTVRAHSCSLCVHIHAVCACTFVQFARAHLCNLCVYIRLVSARTLVQLMLRVASLKASDSWLLVLWSTTRTIAAL